MTCRSKEYKERDPSSLMHGQSVPLRYKVDEPPARLSNLPSLSRVQMCGYPYR